MTKKPSDGPHIVIIGAGFGGLAAASALARSGFPITVIDKTNYNLFVPLLYQVATAALAPGDIAEPIRKVLSRYPNIDVLMAEVEAIDTANRVVSLRGGRTLPYDRLILGTGSHYNYFGRDGWEAVAPGLKGIEDARRIRSRLLMSFETAEMTDDPERQAALMTTIIVGGGPTGVEMAGSIAELARYTLARDFRHIRPELAKIILVEAAPRLLGGFDPKLSDYALKRLKKLGVTVLLGQHVDDLRADGAVIAGAFMPAGTLIWAAGVRASAAAQWLGIQTDGSGRIPVNGDLSVKGLDGVYALGDTALCLDEHGKPLPALGQVAKQQGTYLGRALGRHLRDQTPMRPFRFHNRGNAGIIGRNAAFFDFGWWRLTGFPAWVLWAIVHVWGLVGFENRMQVTLHWLWRYVSYQSGSRLITNQEAPLQSPDAAATPMPQPQARDRHG
jgi:NADH:ubiquinone reductase (H+-translocating)